MNQEEVESQLSAMYDGELPATEVELLSRRIDRDERLRARWSRYAMIGAVLRSEPVAAVGGDFAVRVSAAIAAQSAAQTKMPQRRAFGRAGTFWRGVLAASLVAAVAGLSLQLLRDSSLNGGPAAPASTLVAASKAPQATAAPTIAARNAAPALSGPGEPVSYVTPPAGTGGSPALQSQLANYIVAHSEYSRPLLRRNVLSELVSSESAADSVPATADARVVGAIDGTGGGR